MRSENERARTAYHEAGHVVVAYEFGWWVRRGGVRLWPLPRVKLLYRDYTVLARVCVSMAGLLAEQKFHGVQWRFEEDVVKHVQTVRAGKDEIENLFPSDLRKIALALIDDDPLISCDLNGVRSVVAYYRDITNALL